MNEPIRTGLRKKNVKSKNAVSVYGARLGCMNNGATADHIPILNQVIVQRKCSPERPLSLLNLFVCKMQLIANFVNVLKIYGYNTI